MALYYLIDDDPDLRYDEDSLDALLDYCIDYEYWLDDTDNFDESLDYDYGSIQICGYNYSASSVLKAVDESSYYDELNNWAHSMADNEYDNAKYELRHTNPGDYCYVCNYRVCAYEEIDDEDCGGDYDGDEDLKLYKHIEEKHKEETRVSEENKRLEGEFMNLFQTIC